MRHKGHIRQRSENSFELRYNLGKDPITGQRKVKTVTIQGTRKEAEKELRRILGSLETNEYVEPSKITVRDYLKQWLETTRSRISPKTHESYSAVVDHFLIPVLGSQILPKLAPMTIQKAYTDWENSGRRDKKPGGLAARSRLYIHRILKLALKDAVGLLLIARNPADAVKAPRIKKAIITTLSVEQSAILLDAINGTPLYWSVLLALTTGMRRGEILALRWKNLDLENKTVRIVESLEQTRKGVRFKAPKTNKTRAVILPEYACEELKRLKKEQAEKFVELKISQNGETLVCCRYDGETLWPTSLTHEFTKAIQKLPNLPRVRFHDLRHSHATQLLTAGIHPKIAQERLGHTTITTTLDLYSHATDTMQDEAALKLDNAFRSAIKARPKAPQLG